MSGKSPLSDTLEKRLVKAKPTDIFELIILAKRPEHTPGAGRKEVVDDNRAAVQPILDYLRQQNVPSAEELQRQDRHRMPGTPPAPQACYLDQGGLGMVTAYLTREHIYGLAKHPSVESIIENFEIEHIP